MDVIYVEVPGGHSFSVWSAGLGVDGLARQATRPDRMTTSPGAGRACLTSLSGLAQAGRHGFDGVRRAPVSVGLLVVIWVLASSRAAPSGLARVRPTSQLSIVASSTVAGGPR